MAQVANLLRHGRLVVLPDVGRFPRPEQPQVLAAALGALLVAR